MRRGRMRSLQRRSCSRSLPARFSSVRSAHRANPIRGLFDTVPKPDFFVLWIYAVLAYLPPNLETPLMFIVPALVICAMLLLPLVAGEGEKHWSRRPVAVLMLAVIAVTLGCLYSAWHLYAVESDHGCVDERFDPRRLSPRPNAAGKAGGDRLPGQAVPQLPFDWGAGGLRGPALDSIAARMTEDQMVRQVVQGGGNMPAYGNALRPTKPPRWLVSSARCAATICRPAIDASRRMVLTSETGERRQDSIRFAFSLVLMPSAYRDIFAAWSLPIVLTGTLIVFGIVYMRGWFAIRRTRPGQFSAIRLGFFCWGFRSFGLRSLRRSMALPMYC